MRTNLRLPLVLLAATVFTPRTALAGPEDRAPAVQWPADAPCNIVVDRSVETVVHFDYAIEAEDPEPFPGELPDSRTHQFFASGGPQVLVARPVWITADDVQRAELAGLIDPGSVDSERILDQNPVWADTSRITADDDRRRITFEVAAQGFDWDVSGIEAGIYDVSGYSFAPPRSGWHHRWGFVKVVDDYDDPEQHLPAVRISAGGYWWPGAQNQLRLCVDGSTPATAYVEWAALADELDWQALEDFPIEQVGLTTLGVFGPQAGPSGQSGNWKVEGRLRVRLVDSLGRESVAYDQGGVTFERCLGHCDGDDWGDGPIDPDTVDPAVEVEQGCACSHAGERPLTASLWGLLWGVVWLRRRSTRAARSARS